MNILATIASNFCAERTRALMHLDLRRAVTRLKHHRRRIQPASAKLHMGCGKRRIDGWLNVDIVRSDYDVDLACGQLPFLDSVFKVVVSEHVIEHLELRSELLPLLRELHRCLCPDGEAWLSCPDLQKICNSYSLDKAAGLYQDRRTRFPGYSLGSIPSQYFINELFHQNGEHRNLFDFELLSWALRSSGFSEVTRISEADLLARFPEIPYRGDDFQSLYVRAAK